MYKAPTAENFELITDFWKLKITKAIQTAKDTPTLAPYHITAQNIQCVELDKKLFNFKMSNNHNMLAVMHFTPITGNAFKSRTYEETLTILAIKKIITHARNISTKKLFFHSNYAPILESMFTVGFEKFTIISIGSGGTSVCAQKSI